MTIEESRSAETTLHVNTILLASRRALDNALEDLGFPQDDDRIIEVEGKLGFLTCSHDDDCDDLFALIAELASRGETWELRFRIDTSETRAIFQTLSRHKPVSAIDAEIPPEADEAQGTGPVHDLATPEGVSGMKRALGRTRPEAVFASIRTQPSGRATAVIVERNTKRTVATVTAETEHDLRQAIREVLPNVMFSLAMAP